jgi:hypothetical protein
LKVAETRVEARVGKRRRRRRRRSEAVRRWRGRKRTWWRLTPTAPAAATSKQPSSVHSAAARTLETPSRPEFEMVFISATRSCLPHWLLICGLLKSGLVDGFVEC